MRCLLGGLLALWTSAWAISASAAVVSVSFTGVVDEVVVGDASPELLDALANLGVGPGAAVAIAFSYPEPLFLEGQRSGLSYALSVASFASTSDSTLISMLDDVLRCVSEEPCLQDSIFVWGSNVEPGALPLPENGFVSADSTLSDHSASVFDFDTGDLPESLDLADFTTASGDLDFMERIESCGPAGCNIIQNRLVSFGFTIDSATAVVPEPESALLVCTGLALVAALRRRRPR